MKSDMFIAGDNISIKPLRKSRCSGAMGRDCDRGISWLIDGVHTLMILLTLMCLGDYGASDVVNILQLKL